MEDTQLTMDGLKVELFDILKLQAELRAKYDELEKLKNVLINKLQVLMMPPIEKEEPPVEGERPEPSRR